MNWLLQYFGTTRLEFFLRMVAMQVHSLSLVPRLILQLIKSCALQQRVKQSVNASISSLISSLPSSSSSCCHPYAHVEFWVQTVLIPTNGERFEICHEVLGLQDISWYWVCAGLFAAQVQRQPIWHCNFHAMKRRRRWFLIDLFWAAWPWLDGEDMMLRVCLLDFHLTIWYTMVGLGMSSCRCRPRPSAIWIVLRSTAHKWESWLFLDTIKGFNWLWSFPRLRL